MKMEWGESIRASTLKMVVQGMHSACGGNPAAMLVFFWYAQVHFNFHSFYFYNNGESVSITWGAAMLCRCWDYKKQFLDRVSSFYYVCIYLVLFKFKLCFVGERPRGELSAFSDLIRFIMYYINVFCKWSHSLFLFLFIFCRLLTSIQLEQQ